MQAISKIYKVSATVHCVPEGQITQPRGLYYDLLFPLEEGKKTLDISDEVCFHS